MASKVLKPVYVLSGTDAFLREAHCREIVAGAIGDADPQLCVAHFDATVELAAVFDELRTAPFLAPRRVVIVRDADTFVTAWRKRLEEYLKAPSATGVLVLIVSNWRAPTKLDALVKKIGQMFDCSEVDARTLPRWLRQAAAKHGKKIATDAMELLIQWVGADRAALATEMEKLAAYVGSRDTITGQDISAVVTAAAGPGAFALTDALVAGDAAAALAALDGMLTVRGAEFRVLGIIRWHLGRVLLAHQRQRAGRAPESALSPRTPPGPKRAFVAMVQRRPLSKVQSDFRRLIRADLAMKSGADPTGAVQDLVVALCT